MEAGQAEIGRELMDGLAELTWYALLFGLAGGFIIWLIFEKFWLQATCIMAGIPFFLLLLTTGQFELSILLGGVTAFGSAVGVIAGTLVRTAWRVLRRTTNL